MNKRVLLIPALLCFMCVTSFAQLDAKKKADSGSVLFSESFDAKMVSLERADLKDIHVTMSVAQLPTDEDGYKTYLEWRCVVVDDYNGKTLMDFEAPGTLDFDYKEDDHFYVVSAGSAKYRIVVDMNKPSPFHIIEPGTDGPKNTWVIHPLQTSGAQKGNQWIDRYLCWAFYSNFLIVNTSLSNGMKEKFFERRVAFMRDILSTYPNGVMQDRDKSFVTPRQLVDRLKDSIDPSVYTKPVTQQERESTTNRSLQIQSENSGGSTRQYSKGTADDTDDPTKVKNLKNLLARFFQRMLDNNSTKEISVLSELLKGHQALPFLSSEYLRKGAGGGRNFTILEMLQHPCLLLPTFPEAMSMKNVQTQVTEVFPYTNIPRRVSRKDYLVFKSSDIEQTECPRVEGNELKSMQILRISKNIWDYEYVFEFGSQDKAKAFFCDVCAELAYEGFEVKRYHKDEAVFGFMKMIPDGNKTLVITYHVHLINFQGDWKVLIHGVNYHIK